MPEMDKNPAEIFVILFKAVIQFFDLRAFQKTQNGFFELAAAFAGNDLHQAIRFSTAS